jgi:hypothetical protein
MYYKLICLLYALLCGQNFILVKSGCYSSTCNNYNEQYQETAYDTLIE